MEFAFFKEKVKRFTLKNLKLYLLKMSPEMKKVEFYPLYSV